MGNLSDTFDIEGARSEYDEDGFHIRISTDEEDFDFRIASIPMAKEFLSAASRLRSWIAEHDHERAEFDAATPAQREQVINPQFDDHETWCPRCSRTVTAYGGKCPTCGTETEEQGTGDDDPDALLEAADLDRKARRERGE